MRLRRYQQIGVETILASSVRRLLVVAPTGSGKTVVIAALCRKLVADGRRVLVVAHRRELINQTHDHLLELGVSDVGVVMASDDRADGDAAVQVASIDTLRRRTAPPSDVVIIDEAHRAMAESYVKLADLYPDARIIGFTATPWRHDGKLLLDAFDDVFVAAKPSELVKAGHLTAPVIFTVPSDAIDLRGVKVRGGDYAPEELSSRMNTPRLVGSITGEWAKHAKGRRTVVFGIDRAHARSIADAFKQRRVAVEYLDGDTPLAERAGMLSRLESGKTRVVVNVNVLSEGWDMPPCKCLVLARPTRSLTFYLQQAGRILRPWEGERPIILDHAGNALRFGFPHTDRDYKLAAHRATSTGEAPCKRCDGCGAVVNAGARVCPECGFDSGAMPLQDADRLLSAAVASGSRWCSRPKTRPSRPGTRTRPRCRSGTPILTP